MPVVAISEYKFPSKSRQELYGDDQLVHVWWKGNPWFVAAGCFRFPKAMPWGDFVGVLKGFYTADPDFVRQPGLGPVGHRRPGGDAGSVGVDGSQRRRTSLR
jgi:hypothetical protein